MNRKHVPRRSAPCARQSFAMPSEMKSGRAQGALLWGVVVVMTLAMSCPGTAEVWQAAPANYRQLIPRLQPGDELQLAAGEYRRGLPVHRLSGTAERPVVITGASPGAPSSHVRWPESAM